MDYGKLAYLKVTELEGAGTGAAVGKNGMKWANASVEPFVNLRSECELARFSANGSTAILIRAEFIVPESVRGGALVQFSLNGLTSATVDVSAGNAVALMSAETDGECALSAKSTDGSNITLKKADIMLMGANAAFLRGTKCFAAASMGQRACIISSKDGGLAANSFFEGRIGADVWLGRALSADVAAHDSGYVLAIADFCGNLFAVLLDEDLHIISRKVLGESAKSAAVGVYGGEVWFAVVREGKPYVFKTDLTLKKRSAESIVDFSSAADAVGFVKDAPTVMLVISADGKNFLKTAETQNEAGDVFEMRASAIAEAVS